jgi:hypothetical protein
MRDATYAGVPGGDSTVPRAAPPRRHTSSSSPGAIESAAATIRLCVPCRRYTLDLALTTNPAFPTVAGAIATTRSSCENGPRPGPLPLSRRALTTCATKSGAVGKESVIGATAVRALAHAVCPSTEQRRNRAEINFIALRLAPENGCDTLFTRTALPLVDGLPNKDC